MKNLITLLLLCATISFGQDAEYDFNADLVVGKYEIDHDVPGQKYVQIPCGYNATELQNQIPDSLNDLSIVRIDLVFTTFRSAPDFDQEGLNESRINRFKKEWPGADDPLIDWRRIGQSSATVRTDAEKMFHGFVIYYRPTPTKESIEAELSFIDDFLNGTLSTTDNSTESSTPTTTTSDPVEETSSHHESITVDTDASYSDMSMDGIVLEESGDGLTLVYGNIQYTRDAMVIPFEAGDKISWNHDKYVAPGLTYDGTCFLVDCYTRIATKDQYEIIKDSIERDEKTAWHFVSKSRKISSKTHKYHFYVSSYMDNCDSIVDTGDMMTTWAPGYSSSWMDNADYGVVEAVFRRNPHWMNSLVVMDVTGSMSPYIAKTMAWVKATQDSSQVKAFVFFNDGDTKPDRSKVTGSVGGIYSTPNTDFKTVYGKMKHTMQMGGGGDCPENNVEATIEGVRIYPSADEVIMVVDNWATPRDLELVREIGRPVHVIVCGSSSGVNVEYIQLAIDTGGSIHTIENDLDSRDIKSGKSFKVGKFYYALVNGKVVKAEIK